MSGNMISELLYCTHLNFGAHESSRPLLLFSSSHSSSLFIFSLPALPTLTLSGFSLSSIVMHSLFVVVDVVVCLFVFFRSDF